MRYEFFLGIPILLTAFVIFEHLVNVLTKRFPEEWEKEHRPVGLFASARMQERVKLSYVDIFSDLFRFFPYLFTGRIRKLKIYDNPMGAGVLLACKLIFWTPAWIKKEWKLRFELYGLRVCIFFWWYCVVRFGQFAITNRVCP